jgi:hypothetical protein
MTEQQTRIAYTAAYKAHEAAPSYAKAVELSRLAQALVDISDDYQDALDEADDIMGDYEPAIARWQED